MEIKQVKKRDIDPQKEYLIEVKGAYAVEHKLLKGSDLIVYLKSLQSVGISFSAYEVEE